MTSRSTELHLHRLVRQGALRLFDPPLVKGEAFRRRLWVHPELEDWVKTQGIGKDERFFDDVRAFLKSFVTGEDFDDDVKLKPLQPLSGGWFEFRITFNPQTRIFGGFLRQGEFVAVLQQNRRELDRAGFAGSVGRAQGIWGRLFDRRRPLNDSRNFLLGEFFDDNTD